jgi:hypothetical protein
MGQKNRLTAILKLEQNESDYWQLVLYCVTGRIILREHGEFKYRSDAASYVKEFLLTDDCEFRFAEETNV